MWRKAVFGSLALRASGDFVNSFGFAKVTPSQGEDLAVGQKYRAPQTPICKKRKWTNTRAPSGFSFTHSHLHFFVLGFCKADPEVISMQQKRSFKKIQMNDLMLLDFWAWAKFLRIMRRHFKNNSSGPEILEHQIIHVVFFWRTGFAAWLQHDCLVEF